MGTFCECKQSFWYVRLSLTLSTWTDLTFREAESGEFMDCCADANKDHVDCCPIEVPQGDLFYGVDNRPNCLPFLRSKLFEHQG